MAGVMRLLYSGQSQVERDIGINMVEGYVEPGFLSFAKENTGAILTGLLTIIGIVVSIYFGFENWKKSEKEKYEKAQLDAVIHQNTVDLKNQADEIKFRNNKIQSLSEDIIVAQKSSLLKAEEIERLNKEINTQLENKFKPHVIYRYTGFERSSLKLLFVNVGDQ